MFTLCIHGNLECSILLILTVADLLLNTISSLHGKRDECGPCFSWPLDPALITYRGTLHNYSITKNVPEHFKGLGTTEN